MFINALHTQSHEIVAGSLQSGIIFICDHASNFIPPEYNNLGISNYDLNRHIAYDVGAATMTRVLAQEFNAPAILSKFSRLLIDPNRGADDPTLVMRISDGALIKGNATINQNEIENRIQQFHAPYHAAIKQVVNASLELSIVPIIISLHSFTRVMNTVKRPWHIGILWDNDPRLTCPLIEALREQTDLIVGDNQPYNGGLEGDTLNVHATQRGLANTLIEVRNDLISTEADAATWGLRLANILRPLLNAPEIKEICFS